MVSKFLSWLFPMKPMEVEIDHIELQRRAQRESSRFWGGKAPEPAFSSETEFILSERLAALKERGLPIPKPVALVRDGQIFYKY